MSEKLESKTPSDAAACSASPLTGEQMEILKHAAKNARYCGGGPDMDDLVARGLMQYLGTPRWCPDPFYDITPAGLEIIRQNASVVAPPPQDSDSK